MDEYFTNLAEYITENKEKLDSRTKMLEGLLEKAPGVIFTPFGKVITNSSLENNYKEIKLIKRVPEKFKMVEIEKADCYEEPVSEMKEPCYEHYCLPTNLEKSLLNDIKNQTED